MSECIAAEPHTRITTAAIAVDVRALYNTDDFVRVVIEQQRGAIVQAAKVGRLYFVAQDFVAKIPSYWILRAERELEGPVFNSVKLGQFSALILAFQNSAGQIFGVAVSLAIASSFLEFNRVKIVFA